MSATFFYGNFFWFNFNDSSRCMKMKLVLDYTSAKFHQISHLKTIKTLFINYAKVFSYFMLISSDIWNHFFPFMIPTIKFEHFVLFAFPVFVHIIIWIWNCFIFSIHWNSLCMSCFCLSTLMYHMKNNNTSIKSQAMNLNILARSNPTLFPWL